MAGGCVVVCGQECAPVRERIHDPRWLADNVECVRRHGGVRPIWVAVMELRQPSLRPPGRLAESKKTLLRVPFAAHAQNQILIRSFVHNRRLRREAEK